jgi:alkylglycerol monooxygenase
LNVIVYAIPVFLALMAAEYGVGLALGRNVYRLNDAIGSLTAGILSQISGVFTLALRVGIYAVVYDHFAFLSLPADDWRVWLLALLAYDFLYYWNHRVGHECGLFWAAHVVHHQSENFNLSTALRQTSSGAFLSWIFYMPMAIAGVPPVVFVVVGLIDLLYQFWIHTELIGKLGWFDRIFASPSNHRVHHGVNDQYLDKNYGGILIIWDRLFGTFVEEGEKPVYGVRGGLGTFDPIWANVSYYATMADMSWRARDWRDKIWAWFASPGWRPANLKPAEPEPPFDVTAFRLYDPPAGRAASMLVFVALLAMVGATAAFLLAGPQLPLANGLVVFLGLTAVVWAMGALLDGRISTAESLFVFCAALNCAAYALDWRALRDLGTPAAMTLLIAAVVAREGEGAVKGLVVGALTASLVGDTLLLQPALFVAGLVAFLVALASTSRRSRAMSAFCPRVRRYRQLRLSQSAFSSMSGRASARS